MSLSKYFYNGNKVAYCPYVDTWARKNKLTVSKTSGKYGDIVLFDWNHNGSSDHIGFIVKKNKDGSYTTIEGNTSLSSNDNGGCVMVRTRYTSSINYIVRWTHTTENANKLMKVVESQIGYKESPKGSNKTKYGLEYGANGVPWCCEFVWWCFRHADGVPEKPETIPKYPTSNLKKGSEGVQVKSLQLCLNTLTGSKLVIDGEFGILTQNVVKQYQKKKGIEVDGIVGKITLNKIKEDMTKPVTPSKTSPVASGNKVIDVSYWQGTIDWKKAKKDGVGEAFLRASYTSQDSFKRNSDSTFNKNVKGATAEGIKVGAYHYSQATTVEEAKKEAEYIISILKPYKTLITLPVVFDWEFGKRLNSTVAKKNGKAGNTAICKAFCDAIKKAGYKPMVYANYNTFKNYLNYSDVKKFAKIWLAQYASKPSYTTYDYWQYTSSGKVSGINGKVDMNKRKS